MYLITFENVLNAYLETCIWNVNKSFANCLVAMNVKRVFDSRLVSLLGLNMSDLSSVRRLRIWNTALHGNLFHNKAFWKGCCTRHVYISVNKAI